MKVYSPSIKPWLAWATISAAGALALSTLFKPAIFLLSIPAALIVSGILFSRMFKYVVDEGEMIFYEGLFKRTVTRVPLDRIVRFDVKRDPIDMLCGTGTVSIVTEGYAPKLSLKCISGYLDFREHLVQRTVSV
jgi:uncharacterized membrane protein YdbT with pleckstrin-like domain